MATDFNFKNLSNTGSESDNGTQFVYSWNEDACKINKEEELPQFIPAELIKRFFQRILKEVLHESYKEIIEVLE